jgi:hypothetical protein
MYPNNLTNFNSAVAADPARHTLKPIQWRIIQLLQGFADRRKFKPGYRVGVLVALCTSDSFSKRNMVVGSGWQALMTFKHTIRSIRLAHDRHMMDNGKKAAEFQEWMRPSAAEGCVSYDYAINFASDAQQRIKRKMG